ncbi:MAG TPA: carboxypeptidase-like regulatory domain-containing protein [Thermoanaerobaculia bacterium]
MLRALALFATFLLAGAAPAAELEVSGRVLGAGGKPAAHAAVELLADGVPEPLARAVTRADGRFQLAAPGAGMYRVVVRANGTVPMEARLFPLLAPADLPLLRLTADEPLRVQVRGGDAPLGGVRLVARPLQRSADKGWGVATRTAITDDRGAASLPRGVGESLEVTTIGRDFVDVRTTRERTLDVRREPRCARPVIVRAPDGSAAAGVTLSVASFPIGKTDAEGGFVVGAPCHGELRLAAGADDGHRAEGRLLPAAEPLPLQITLQPPEVHSGRVLDAETREPIAGAFVWTDDDAAAFVRTDEKGAWRLTPRAPGGTARFHAAATAHLPSSTGPVFALAPTSALQGQVVDDEGRAVADADVRVEEHAPDAAIRFRRADGPALRTTSRASGAFHVDVLPRRAYVVRARRAGYAPASIVVEKLLPGASKRGLRVVLSRGQSAAGEVVEKETSAPIAGAELRLVTATRAALPRWARGDDDEAEAHEFVAVTGADGSYRFDHLPPGRFDLAVMADGYAPQRVPGLTVTAEQAATFGTVLLERGAIVEGTVVDADDRPLNGATVLVHPPVAAGVRGDAVLRAAADAEETRRGVSGSDGSFLVRGLTPGATADITVRRDGYVTQTRSRVEMPPLEPLRIVLEPSARISGRVVDDRGDVIAGAVVTAKPAESALPVGLDGRLVESDAAGVFVLADLPKSAVALSAVARGFLSAEPLVLDLGVRTNVEDVELTLRRGATVEGVVLTPGGQPAAAARVALRGMLTPERMLEREVAGATRTDGEGRYRLEGVPSGPQSLAASQEGYQSAIRELTVQPGQNQLDFRLGEGFAIGGRVTDSGGAPLGGVAVSLLTSGPGATQNETSAGDGSFRFSGVAPGRFIVSAQKQGYATARQELQLVDRAIEDLDLQLRQGGGVIAGQILGLTARDLPQLQITAMKRPLAGMDGLRDGRANEQFAYRIEGVFPGEWSVTARLPSGRETRRDVTIAAGAADVQVDLEFEPGVTLSGRVQRRGQPVSAATVEARGAAGTSSGSATTDGNGSFRIEGLQPDTHSVIVTVLRSGLRHERTVTLTSDQSIDIDVPVARLSGYVVDAATGAPVTGAIVLALLEGASGAFPPRATTDDAGAFTLDGVGRGRFRVTVSKDGYALTEQLVDVPADDSTIGDLRLVLRR